MMNAEKAVDILNKLLRSAVISWPDVMENSTAPTAEEAGEAMRAGVAALSRIPYLESYEEEVAAVRAEIEKKIETLEEMLKESMKMPDIADQVKRAWEEMKKLGVRELGSELRFIYGKEGFSFQGRLTDPAKIAEVLKVVYTNKADWPKSDACMELTIEEAQHLETAVEYFKSRLVADNPVLGIMDKMLARIHWLIIRIKAGRTSG